MDNASADRGAARNNVNQHAHGARTPWQTSKRGPGAFPNRSRAVNWIARAEWPMADGRFPFSGLPNLSPEVPKANLSREGDFH